MKAYPLLN